MMLNAWHLPVPPFVKQSKDQLLITLWLTGEDPPQRIMLRTEHDNEEMSVSYSAAIFLIPICISFDTAEKRRYATYLILNRRFSFEF
ncbi:hypothetical protein F3W54_004457 [Escherichia coli]|nr:hypothetical protein [Escherichia coli]